MTWCTNRHKRTLSLVPYSFPGAAKAHSPSLLSPVEVGGANCREFWSDSSIRRACSCMRRLADGVCGACRLGSGRAVRRGYGARPGQQLRHVPCAGGRRLGGALLAACVYPLRAKKRAQKGPTSTQCMTLGWSFWGSGLMPCGTAGVELTQQPTVMCHWLPLDSCL